MGIYCSLDILQFFHDAFLSMHVSWIYKKLKHKHWRNMIKLILFSEVFHFMVIRTLFTLHSLIILSILFLHFILQNCDCLCQKWVPIYWVASLIDYLYLSIAQSFYNKWILICWLHIFPVPKSSTGMGWIIFENLLYIYRKHL